ncbi:MAG: hypothetical protein HYV03_00610 [Deltaproteobacteria bacterium]|nr:hypothetical protein [Deltaproteobacteria bacterium]
MSTKRPAVEEVMLYPGVVLRGSQMICLRSAVVTRAATDRHHESVASVSTLAARKISATLVDKPVYNKSVRRG